MKRTLTIKRAERNVTKAVTDLVHWHIKNEVRLNPQWNFENARRSADLLVKDFVSRLLK